MTTDRAKSAIDNWWDSSDENTRQRVRDDDYFVVGPIPADIAQSLHSAHVQLGAVARWIGPVTGAVAAEGFPLPRATSDRLRELDGAPPLDD